MIRLLSLFAVLLMLSACDSGGDMTGVTGTWEGTVVASSGTDTFPITARLRDAGTTITGTGVVELPGSDVFNFTVVDGSFIGTAVNLSIRFDSTPFSGSISGTLTNEDPARIEGTFQGGGVVGNSQFEIELVDR